MTTPVAPVVPLAPPPAPSVPPRRHVVRLHSPERVPGHDDPLELAPYGLRLSAPSGERAVGLVPCGIETERALDALPFVQSAADSAERRVYLAIIFMLGWSAVAIVLPRMWVAGALAILLLVVALWRFSAARLQLRAARDHAQARLDVEGCFPPEIRFLTSPAADLAGVAPSPAPAPVAAGSAPHSPRSTAPRLRLVR